VAKGDGQPSWHGRTLRLETWGVARVIAVIFFSWPPAAFLIHAVSTHGFGGLMVASKPMIFAAVWWSLFAYCWLRTRRFAIDCEKREVFEATRHFFYWSGSRTYLPADVRIRCEPSYGPIHPEWLLGPDSWGSRMHVRLSLVAQDQSWVITEPLATPPGASFLSVRDEVQGLALKLAEELSGALVEDEMGDETHRLVLPAEPGERQGSLEHTARNSILGCMGVAAMGLFLTLFGLLVASQDSVLASLFVDAFGLGILWLGLREGLYRRSLVFDAEQQTATESKGWLRAKVARQYTFDATSFLVVFPGNKDSDSGSNHRPFYLWVIAGDLGLSVPGAASDRFEDVMEHAKLVSAQMGMSIELNGGITVNAYRKWVAPAG
jgi:hypothetical protein